MNPLQQAVSERRRSRSSALLALEALDLGLAVTAGGIEYTQGSETYFRPEGEPRPTPFPGGPASFMINKGIEPVNPQPERDLAPES